MTRDLLNSVNKTDLGLSSQENFSSLDVATKIVSKLYGKGTGGLVKPCSVKNHEDSDYVSAEIFKEFAGQISEAINNTFSVTLRTIQGVSNDVIDNQTILISGPGVYQRGENVTIEATILNTNYKFKNWLINDKEETDNSHTISGIDKDYIIDLIVEKNDGSTN